MTAGAAPSLPRWAFRYLERLGAAPEPPSYDALRRLTRAHLTTCAFENITKLRYYRQREETGWLIPPVETFVESLFALDAGGTCFTANSRFHLLLQALGYDAYLIQVGDDHMGIGVELPEGLFYVDVGVGGPLFAPVQVADEPLVTCCGSGVHIHRKPDAERTFYLDLLLHGEVRERWEFDPWRRAAFEDFAGSIAKMNTPGTLFMRILRCQLWQPDRERALSLVNATLTIRHADGSEEKRPLPSVAAMEAALAEEFGLPRLPVREAVDVLSSLGVDIFAP